MMPKIVESTANKIDIGTADKIEGKEFIANVTSNFMSCDPLLPKFKSSMIKIVFLNDSCHSGAALNLRF